MNNRGWLRIVEASIAIIMILTTLFILYQRSNPVELTDASFMARQVLEEAAHNEPLRLAILTGDLQRQELLDLFIRSRIPSRALAFEARICELDEVCGKTNYTEGEVFAAERVFAAVVTDQQSLVPKKVRLFIWRAQ